MMTTTTTTVVAAKVAGASSLSALTLSALIYNDPNFLTSVYVGLMTGGAVFFMEYAHLDEQTKDNTNLARIISTLIVVLLTVVGIVGTVIYLSEAYIKTTSIELPKMAYVFPAVLIGLSKKEVMALTKTGFTAIGSFIKKKAEK